MNETQQTTALSVANIVQLVIDTVRKSEGNGFVIPEDLNKSEELLVDHVSAVVRSALARQQEGLL